MRLEPKEIVKRLKLNGGKIRQTARELGISPGTVINWRTIATSVNSRLKLSTINLERKSTAPKTTRATTLPAAQQDAIAIFRKQTGHCAEKIVEKLNLDCS